MKGKEEESFEAMSQISTGYALAADEEFDAADERYTKLFTDTVDRLGCAAYEFSCR